MAMRPLLRSLWQRPLRRFALITLLIASAAAWYVTARGGWVNVLHLPPVLDASTPRTQNGFTLKEIKTPGNNDGPWGDDREDAAVLLIRPPAFPRLTAQSQSSDGTSYYGDNYDSRMPPMQASAQTSNGDVTPLNWKIVGTQSGPQFYRVEVPGGYSSECRYMNVTLVPSTGPFPRWRIKRLPNMRHAIPDAPQIADSVTKDGITTTARAWRGRHQIFTQIRPILPNDSHQWELATNDQWSEWEKFDRPRPDGATTWPPILGRGGIFMKQDDVYSSGHAARFPAPYRSASRYVQVDCELHQFETYDEQVTFHNLAVKGDTGNPRDWPLRTYTFVLARPVTLTTPSGVVVTLPAQSRDTSAVMGERINLKITARHTAAPSDLPQSPLVRQFGKPVEVSVKFAPPYDADGYIDAPGDTRTYSMWPPKNPAWHYPQPKGAPRVPLFLDPPPVLKDFTVIIHQRVDLQTIPMTFTVPVSDTPPPDIH